MVYSAPAIKQCTNCSHVDDSAAKFCEGCGFNYWKPVTTINTGGTPRYEGSAAQTEILYPQFAGNGTPTLILPENMPKTVPGNMARTLTNLSDSHVPKFAHVSRVNPELARQRQVELAKLMVLLARERLFLLFHFGVWLCVNLIGFWMSLKCYNEFIGDEMTKIMIGCSPFWVFNILGLTCLVPIRGTRKSIARLKEQIAHARFVVDYGHLM
jgi:hypothetical protein